jgi:hypothetical protein
MKLTLQTYIGLPGRYPNMRFSFAIRVRVMVFNATFKIATIYSSNGTTQQCFSWFSLPYKKK